MKNQELLSSTAIIPAMLWAGYRPSIPFAQNADADAIAFDLPKQRLSQVIIREGLYQVDLNNIYNRIEVSLVELAKCNNIATVPERPLYPDSAEKLYERFVDPNLPKDRAMVDNILAEKLAVVLPGKAAITHMQIVKYNTEELKNIVNMFAGLYANAGDEKMNKFIRGLKSAVTAVESRLNHYIKNASEME